MEDKEMKKILSTVLETDVTENKDAKVENGVLADVAPSILHILGMKQPAEMTGKDLIK